MLVLVHPSTTWSYLGFPMDGALDFCFLPMGVVGWMGSTISNSGISVLPLTSIYLKTLPPFTKRADSVCLGDRVMYEGDTN